MSHRPYPNPSRALKQIERHTFEVGAAAASRPLTPFEQQLLDGTATIVKAIEPMAATLERSVPVVSEYRLSTRPGVVSGES
jgi:hypothetical protein